MYLVFNGITEITVTLIQGKILITPSFNSNRGYSAPKLTERLAMGYRQNNLTVRFCAEFCLKLGVCSQLVTTFAITAIRLSNCNTPFLFEVVHH